MGKDGNAPYLYRGESTASISSIGSSIFRKGDSWVPSLHKVLENGVKIPLFGLGTFQSKKDDAYVITMYALKLGYRHIDTAKVYKNELYIGRAIKDSRIPRSDLFITSKLSPADHGYENALDAYWDSVDNLGCDYLDLYLIHWPACQGIPGDSPQNKEKRKETWKAFEKLYRDGKVKAIGVSNFTVRHLEEMLEYAEILPHVNQVELHPQCQQKELIEFCNKHNILVFPYSPLGQGRLLECEDVIKIAKKKGRSTASILLRWAIQKGYGCIPKTTKASRLLENSRIFDWELTEYEMNLLDDLDANIHYAWDPTNIS